MSFNHYFLHHFPLNSVTNSLILLHSLHHGPGIKISLWNKSIEKFAPRLLYNQGGIETDAKSNDPRLILISVDIEEGATVPFDSYRKPKNGLLKTEYYIKQIGDEESEKRSISYENGINTDHVLASASVPKNFDYVDIKGRKFSDEDIKQYAT